MPVKVIFTRTRPSVDISYEPPEANYHKRDWPGYIDTDLYDSEDNLTRVLIFLFEFREQWESPKLSEKQKEIRELALKWYSDNNFIVEEEIEEI